jgi:hypothetical protein
MSRSTIQTISGVAFDLTAPHPSMLRAGDIAAALSHQGRFAGHTRRFYSVAEHSVRVSWLLIERHPDRPDLHLWGLLHDASEAYLVDLPRPLKQLPGLGEAYLAVERAVMAAVCQRWGLAAEMPPEVRHADDVLLATERRYLLSPPIEGLWGALPEPLTLADPDALGWPSSRASAELLALLARLVG